MAEHDEVLDPPYDEDDEAREDARLASLRTFELVLRDPEGNVRRETVVAHYWDNTNPAGHWNFYTVQASGRMFISTSYGRDEVKRLKEATVARDRGADALERQRQRSSSREVH